MKVYKSLGFLIKDFRQWRELSQQKLAKSIGISIRELQRWEADRRNVRIENLHDFSEATGIPMQVCVALNADQPVWYSLRERLFAYSSIEAELFVGHELYRYRKQSDDRIFIRTTPLATDKQISEILSCHHDIYGTEGPGKDVIKAASMIVPDLNLIAFDCWGHYVGHLVCIPIKKRVYAHIKKQKGFAEGYLTTERITDIVTLHEGTFFTCSIFAASASVANQLIIDSARGLVKIEQKERYLIAGMAATREIEGICKNLGMRIVFNKQIEQVHTHSAIMPATMYEIELDDLIKRYENLGTLQKVLENYGKREGKKVDSAPLIVDKPLYPAPLIVDKEEQNDETWLKTQKYKLNMEAFPNLKCTLCGKTGKDNIVFNGKYQTKGGNLVHRFLCKKCGKSFCSRARSIFYDLRTPEEKVLMAFKLLVKGMSLRGVAKTLKVKFDTVQYWLKVAAEQSGEIDALLVKELKVPQEELDALWTSVKSNSLRQRAILWKGKNDGIKRHEDTLA